MHIITKPYTMKMTDLWPIVVVWLAAISSIASDDDITPMCRSDLDHVMKHVLHSSGLEYHEPEVTTQKATFSMGCFWGAEPAFGALPGVVRVKAGYTGGTRENPTYEDLGDHTESVEIDYDPERTTYSELLDAFFANHDSTKPNPVQYQSFIYYRNDEQRKLAHQSMDDRMKQLKKPIHTRMSLAKDFYEAENYHQKYFLRLHENFVNSLGLTDDDLMHSWRATRLLGFMTGHGDWKTLEAEKSLLGLTYEHMQYIHAVYSSYREGGCSQSAKKDEL